MSNATDVGAVSAAVQAASIDHSQTIKAICDALASGNDAEAAAIAERDYPFCPVGRSSRHYTFVQMVRVFHRDGYIDRYSGQRLVFPGVLRLLHLRLPNQFPFQTNWKMSETHMVYWQLSPTVDHLVPVARDGKDEFDNWVSTSMIRNSAKANWLLEELGWTLHEPGNLEKWDGLTGWFLREMDKRTVPENDSYLNSWHRALREVHPSST